ncbi:putative sulfate transporter, partial [Trifolium pratense]
MKSIEMVKPKQVAQANECGVFLSKYRPLSDDVEWVQKGLVATVLNGEAIPVVQNRLSDAGFSDLILIPMGADKVFVRSLEGADALLIVNGAKEFFKLVFSHWIRWDQDVTPYRRGAWVRLYGVPLNAWNINFFKLCVLDCGSYLRTDKCTADKDRLDFARVLVATPDLGTINSVVTILVDGAQVQIQVVEEWGYALGEDTCLFEEESETEDYYSDLGEG